MNRAYVRHSEGMPANENLCSAALGMRLRGAEIVPFYFQQDIPVGELGPDACVCGYVGDVIRTLDVMGCRRPEPLDYPSELTSYLHREVTRTTLGEVRRQSGRVFVKPVQHKVFTGLVYEHRDARARLELAEYPDSLPVWTSPVLDIRSEYRVFVLGSEVIGVRHYRGDWSRALDHWTVSTAVERYTSAPAAYALDFGYGGAMGTSPGWLLIEANDAFALGSYGLAPALYAQMIEARWRQMCAVRREKVE